MRLTLLLLLPAATVPLQAALLLELLTACSQTLEVAALGQTVPEPAAAEFGMPGLAAPQTWVAAVAVAARLLLLLQVLQRWSAAAAARAVEHPPEARTGRRRQRSHCRTARRSRLAAGLLPAAAHPPPPPVAWPTHPAQPGGGRQGVSGAIGEQDKLKE